MKSYHILQYLSSTKNVLHNITRLFADPYLVSDGCDDASLCQDSQGQVVITSCRQSVASNYSSTENTATTNNYFPSAVQDCSFLTASILVLDFCFPSLYIIDHVSLLSHLSLSFSPPNPTKSLFTQPSHLSRGLLLILVSIQRLV